MSMLSAQCDRLRELADGIEERYGYPTAVTALRDAADTIWSLRNRCVDLARERERLSKESDFFSRQVLENGERCDRAIDQLNAENDRLRELVADAWSYINHPADASWTHEKRKEIRGSLADRMRELDIVGGA